MSTNNVPSLANPPQQITVRLPNGGTQGNPIFNDANAQMRQVNGEIQFWDATSSRWLVPAIEAGKIVLRTVAAIALMFCFAGQARAAGTVVSRTLSIGTNDVVIGETNIIVNGTITATKIVGTLTDTNKADKSYVDNAVANKATTNYVNSAVADKATTNYVIAATNGLFSASAIDSYYAYPVFELSIGGQWTDFEIKASTNNFVGDNLVYFYMSSATNAIADDNSPLTYFVDDYAVDVRKWVSATPHTPIATQITNALTEVETVVFMPSRDTQISANNWMWRSNTNLVWSYARYGAIGYETNATGTKSHWQPIRPQSWENARTVIR